MPIRSNATDSSACSCAGFTSPSLRITSTVGPTTALVLLPYVDGAWSNAATLLDHPVDLREKGTYCLDPKPNYLIEAFLA